MYDHLVRKPVLCVVIKKACLTYDIHNNENFQSALYSIKRDSCYDHNAVPCFQGAIKMFDVKKNIRILGIFDVYALLVMKESKIQHTQYRLILTKSKFKFYV